MAKVRWGILSTAKIGVAKVIPAMQRAAHCEIRAIASRDLQQAREAAAALNIPRAYGSYDELLADPEIDAVYNPLPNHLHVPLSLRALEAGKHVLCEKPIALSAAEAEQLAAAGRRHPELKLMEAFMYRFHPQWQRAKDIVRSADFGALRAISTVFSYSRLPDDNIRNVKDWGGGGLMDIGCYPISLSRFLFEAEPRRAAATLEFDEQFGVDRLASAILDFGHGTSIFTCSTQMVPYQRVHAFGTAQRVEIEIPFNAPPDRPCRIWRCGAGPPETIDLPVTDQYTVQGELFAQAVLEGGPTPTSFEDAVANMRAIDAVFRAAASGRWEQVV